MNQARAAGPGRGWRGHDEGMGPDLCPCVDLRLRDGTRAVLCAIVVLALPAMVYQAYIKWGLNICIYYQISDVFWSGPKGTEIR